MLLAFTLLLGLAVPASAQYDYHGWQYNSGDKSFVQNYFAGSAGGSQTDYWTTSNGSLFMIAYFIKQNLDALSSFKYTYDQSDNAQISPVQYLAYALHGLKGTITSSGTILASNDLGSDSKDYFLTRWFNMNSNATITDANRWRIQTLSDNSQYSWLYQVASGAGSMQLLTDALMNWSNPNFGMYSPADTANYSWFNQVLSSVQGNKLDVSGLAKESTLSTFSSDTKTALTTVNSRLRSLSVNVSQSHISDTIDGSLVVVDPKTGDLVFQSDAVGGPFFPVTALNLESQLLTLYHIYSDLHSIDEILATENDRALEEATDDTKVTVKDYVSDKKSNYGDSFTIGNTISDGLKPDLTTSQASSAVGGLFSQSSSDYYGWFSSETDNDLHPGASGTSTLSLEDEPSSQDVADSETVWVIDPYASSSDLISDFFGGE